jgi:Fe-S cluster assembly protein SufD
MNVDMLDRFHQAFGTLGSTLAGANLLWLRNARRRAFEQFGALGLPPTRDEDWKYTNVSALERRTLHFAPSLDGEVRADRAMACDAAALASTDEPTQLLVFVNGCYTPALSRTAGVAGHVFAGSITQALDAMPERLEPLIAACADAPANGFAALNSAFFSDGYVIALPRDCVLDAPIHVLFIADEPELANQPFNVVFADAGSQCEIVEHFIGLSDAFYLTNVSTHIVADDGARVDHYRLQQEGRHAFHIASVTAVQRRASHFASHAFAFGAALSRADIATTLDAEDAHATLNGLYVATGRQHVDHHTRIDHAKPRGTSRETYRGVLDGAARGVFNGKVIVHPDAQRTDAHQANHNLLLSRDAEVDTKPQLEIYADDVKCTHGASVGQLDDNQLFYLRARGIDEPVARAVLCHAFARDIVDRVGVPALRTRIEALLLAHVPHGERIAGLTSVGP